MDLVLLLHRKQGGYMNQLQLFKIQLKLARQYLTGKDSGRNFSLALAESHARNAETTADLNLDPSMSLEARIKWMEAFN